MCQRAKGVPVIQIDVPTYHKTCQFFEHSSYKLLRKIYILYYHVKCSTLCLRPVIHAICICIICKNCIILHFYTLSHIKEKWVEFLFFKTFLPFSYKWKYKENWFLYVTSNKGFLEFSLAKTTKKNEKYVWISWSYEYYELDIWDSYNKLYCNYISFCFLIQLF